MVLKACTFKTNKTFTVFTYQMFWVYSVLTYSSQIEFRLVFLYFITLFMLDVTLLFHFDHLLIAKFGIFHLSCYQKLFGTLCFLKCLLNRIRKSSFIHKTRSGRWNLSRSLLDHYEFFPHFLLSAKTGTKM